MLRSSFVPRFFFAPRALEQPPLGSGFPGLPSRRISGEPLPQFSGYEGLLQRRRPPDPRTVGFNEATPTLLPGMEILWMRLFDQRNNIGIGSMPTKLVDGLQQIGVSTPATVGRTYGLYSTGHVRKCHATSVLCAAALHPHA
jgi:hypothetical protein